MLSLEAPIIRKVSEFGADVTPARTLTEPSLWSESVTI